MKKTIIAMLFSILLMGIVFAVTEQTSSFYGQSNPFNITFAGGDNHSYSLVIPNYVYVRNITLSILSSLDARSFSTFEEDFSTTTYRDAYNNVNWDNSLNLTINESNKESVVDTTGLTHEGSSACSLNETHSFVADYTGYVTYVSFGGTASPTISDDIYLTNGNTYYLCRRDGWTDGISTSTANCLSGTFVGNSFSIAGSLPSIGNAATGEGTSYYYDGGWQALENLCDGGNARDYRVKVQVSRNYNSQGYTSTIKLNTGSDNIYSAIMAADNTTPANTDIKYYLSADGGSNWEEVTLGTEHYFANVGNDLRAYFNLTTTSTLISPDLDDVEINYTNDEAINLSIYVNGRLESVFSANYNGSHVNSFNITYINNQVSTEEVPLNIIFYATDALNATINLTNATYSYGFDNCSNSLGIPSNATALNISFQTIAGSPSPVNLTSLFTFDSFSYYSTATSTTNETYCIYPSWANLSYTSSIQYVDTGGSNYYNYPTGYFSSSTLNLIYYTSIGTEQTVFTIKDNVDKQKVIAGAFCTSYLSIGGEYTPIETKYSDIAGHIQFNYLEYSNYQFVCSATNYATYTFVLNPITSETYDIFLTPLSSASYSNTFDRISMNVNPQFFREGSNNFTFRIHSFYSELSSYSYILTYPGGTTTDSGADPDGETMTNTFTIINPTLFDSVQLNITYTMPVFGTKHLTYYYPIVGMTNNTLTEHADPTYGMGLIERLIIVVFGAVLIAGLCALVGMDLFGMGLQAFWSGYWCAVEFVPLWAFLPSIFIIIIILGWRSQ